MGRPARFDWARGSNEISSVIGSVCGIGQYTSTRIDREGFRHSVRLVFDYRQYGSTLVLAILAESPLGQVKS